MKRFLPLIALFLFACGPNTTPAVTIAGFGLAGSSLALYCATPGSNCSPDLISYGQQIIAEASKEATLIESGSTTTAVIGQILLDVNMDIAKGKTLTGLTQAQAAYVSAVISTGQSVIAIVQALTPPATVEAKTVTVSIPAPSAADKQKLAQMRTSVAAAKK